MHRLMLSLLFFVLLIWSSSLAAQGPSSTENLWQQKYSASLEAHQERRYRDGVQFAEEAYNLALKCLA